MGAFKKNNPGCNCCGCPICSDDFVFIADQANVANATTDCGYTVVAGAAAVESGRLKIDTNSTLVELDTTHPDAKARNYLKITTLRFLQYNQTFRVIPARNSTSGEYYFVEVEVQDGTDASCVRIGHRSSGGTETIHREQALTLVTWVSGQSPRMNLVAYAGETKQGTLYVGCDLAEVVGPGQSWGYHFEEITLPTSMNSVAIATLTGNTDLTIRIIRYEEHYDDANDDTECRVLERCESGPQIYRDGCNTVTVSGSPTFGSSSQAVTLAAGNEIRSDQSLPIASTAIYISFSFQTDQANCTSARIGDVCRYKFFWQDDNNHWQLRMTVTAFSGSGVDSTYSAKLELVQVASGVTTVKKDYGTIGPWTCNPLFPPHSGPSGVLCANPDAAGGDPYFILRDSVYDLALDRFAASIGTANKFGIEAGGGNAGGWNLTPIASYRDNLDMPHCSPCHPCGSCVAHPTLYVTFPDTVANTGECDCEGEIRGTTFACDFFSSVIAQNAHQCDWRYSFPGGQDCSYTTIDIKSRFVVATNKFSVQMAMFTGGEPAEDLTYTKENVVFSCQDFTMTLPFDSHLSGTNPDQCDFSSSPTVVISNSPP